MFLVGPYYAGVLNGVIFCDMVLKGPALYVCLWEFACEHLKNNANKLGPALKGPSVNLRSVL